MTLYNVVKQSSEPQQELLYSEFLSAVERKDVLQVTIKGNQITGEFKSRTEPFKTYAPEHDGLIDST